MRGLCRGLVAGFAIAWLAALGLLAVGALGLFGAERDPLSAVFLIPLGLPWNLWLNGFADAARPWLAMLAPLVNLAILAFACRVMGRR
jgi:hypothetical protein